MNHQTDEALDELQNSIQAKLETHFEDYDYPAPNRSKHKASELVAAEIVSEMEFFFIPKDTVRAAIPPLKYPYLIGQPIFIAPVVFETVMETLPQTLEEARNAGFNAAIDEITQALGLEEERK